MVRPAAEASAAYAERDDIAAPEEPSMSSQPPPPDPTQPDGGQHSGPNHYQGGPHPGPGQSPQDQHPYGQYTQGQYPPPAWQHQQQPAGDDRTIAVLAHLSPVIAMVLSAGWLSFLGPLIAWLVWRDRGPLIRNAAASAFNFNITVWVANIAGWICFFTILLIPVAIVLWAVAWIAQIVLSIIGAMRASNGEVYRYPMQVPILQ